MPIATFEAPSEHWAHVDGVRTRYLRCGRGPSLLLLHGLLGYSFSWRFTMPALGSVREIYAPDMPGFGFSDFSEKLDYSLEGCAGRLLRFMDSVGIDSCDLLGSSHGGAVAMAAAARAPRRICRLILVAPVNPWSQHGKLLATVFGLAAVRPLLMKSGPKLKFLYPWVLHRLYGDRSRVPPGTLEGYSRPFQRKEAFGAVTRILNSWSRDVQKLRSALPRIANIPILLIWGDSDPAVDPDSAEVLRKQFRDCGLVVFAGVGHLPYEETPAEFNRALADFLSSSIR